MLGVTVFDPLGLPGGAVLMRRRAAERRLEAVAHVDLTDAGALVFVPGHSMALLGNSGYRIAVRDSSGRAALGFAGPAGTGAEPGLEAADTVSGITKANPGVVSFSAAHALATGNLVKISGLTEMTELNGKYVNLRGQTGDAFNILDTSGYGAAETTGGDVAARVDNPGSDGLTVYQDKDLTTRGWAWVDPGFDPNDIEEIIVDRTEDLRLFQVGLNLGGPTPDIGAGGVSYIRSGIVYAVDEAGLLEAFGANVIPRERVKPIGLPEMDLFRHEGAATNLVKHSEAFNNSYWTPVRSTLNSGAADPKGGTDAFDWVPSVDNATHRLDLTDSGSHIPVSEGDVITVSVWAKAGSVDQLALNAEYYDSAYGYLSNTGAQIHATTLGSSLQRLDWTITVPDNTPDSAYLKLMFYQATGGSTSFAGDGSTVGLTIFGAQAELSSFITSYIPTSGSTATRPTAAGHPSYQFPGNFSQTAGQAMVMIVPGVSGIPGANGGFIATWDGYGSVAYTNGSDVVITDGPNYTNRSPTWTADSPMWLVAQWWDAASQPSGTTNAQGIRIGAATISGGAWVISWAGDAAYDGAFTAGSLLRMFYSNSRPYWWADLLVFPAPLTDVDTLALATELARPE